MLKENLPSDFKELPALKLERRFDDNDESLIVEVVIPSL
jgi:hypothetical protein